MTTQGSIESGDESGADIFCACHGAGGEHAAETRREGAAEKPDGVAALAVAAVGEGRRSAA